MTAILQKLKGGDLRSIGRTDEVVQDILNNPSFFGEVFEGMAGDDPISRMRCADAIEKVSDQHPEYLQPYKSRLINELAKTEQKEVRWHVAQMFSYIKIDNKERNIIMKILLNYLENDTSRIVKTFSLQTLADFAERDKSIQSQVIAIIEKAMESGIPAILSRGRKLLAKLKG